MTFPHPWNRPGVQVQQPGTTAWSQRGTATSTVQPLPGILPGQNLLNPANWRAFLYSLSPVIVTAMTGLHLETGNRASVWVALAMAIVTPLVSSLATPDKLRQLVYGVTGLLSSAGFVATLLVGQEAWIPVVSAVVTILSAILARYYVPVSTLIPKT